MLDLLRGGKRILCPLVVMAGNWYIATFVYYGIIFGLQFMKNVNFFLLGILAAVAELVGVVTSAFWANKIGRKKSILCNHFLLGVSCAIYQVCVSAGAPNWVFFICIIIAKYCSTAGFNIIYLMTS